MPVPLASSNWRQHADTRLVRPFVGMCVSATSPDACASLNPSGFPPLLKGVFQEAIV